MYFPFQRKIVIGQFRRIGNSDPSTFPNFKGMSFWLARNKFTGHTGLNPV
jgi:hypothetical protein